jgi:tripartite ATP-independent transporter DctP family solute receptor
MRFSTIVAATVFLLGVTQAQATETLKIGHVLPKGSQFSEAIKVMNEELAKSTGGAYQLEEFPASALGSGADVLDSVRLGTVDMVMSSSGGALSLFNPTVGILDLMMLFRDPAHADAVLDGPIGEELLESFKQQDTVGLAWGENGFRQLTNSVRPITKPEDLKGLKIRLTASEIYKAAFTTLGAETFSLPFSQLYPALQSGKADGQENPVTTIVGSNLQEVQKYITLSNHTYAPAVILINKDLFDEFPPEVREAFVAAAKTGGKASRDFVRQRDVAGLDVLKASGIEITGPDGFDRAAFEEALKPFYDTYAKQFTMEKIEAIRNTK